MTGTPLDMTPFGVLIPLAGLAYWLVGLAALALALWIPRRLSVKGVLSAAVIAMFVIPLVIRVNSIKAREAAANAAYQAKLAAATKHYEMRCQSSGEKIVRKVDNVDGIVWMKWRLAPEPQDYFDQFRLNDPYGTDCREEGCIEMLLRLSEDRERFTEAAELQKSRFKFIETIDPKDGLAYRYVGAMVPRWDISAVMRHRRETGRDVDDNVYWFKSKRTVIPKLTARYGVTWEDISTREDREHWVAGGSLRIVDLQTMELIAERTGYMMDRGLGS